METNQQAQGAVGPPLPRLQAAATIGVGINSLLIVGLLAPLLGALVDEHRLTSPQIGLTATVELLAMAIGTGLAGMLMAPQRLKLIGVATSLVLAAFDLATTKASGMQVLAARAGAGAAEGMLLWITVGMIARTAIPERWAGAFFTAQAVAQLLLALTYAAFIIPKFGANGGYLALALCSLAGIAPALALPSRYAPLVANKDQSGPPPLRGWIALLATLAFVSAHGAVAVYLQRYALQAGLTPNVARTAVWVSLAAQVAGSAAATALAGKVRWFHVFVAGTVLWLVAWTCFSLRIPAGPFVAANALSGLVGLFVGPFFVPMTIEADPSRRAALQSGAAQLLGGAAGPLMAFGLVSERDAHKVLILGAALLLSGLTIMAWLRGTHRKTPASPGTTSED